VAGVVLLVMDVFAGWSYLASYFGYFRIPVEGLGLGQTQTQRLIVAALGLLLLVSIPIASGTLDASQKAGTKTTTLRIVTNTAILPNAAPSTTGQFTYANYVLLRESETRYWLFRVGDQYAYSIAKSDVLYIRY
jgi:hypothetical protein